MAAKPGHVPMPRPDWKIWLERNRDALGSIFERMFVEKVLFRFDDIEPSATQAQFAFRDIDGGQRYCDFVIREGKSLRIAIEIDGFDKRGVGHGMTKPEFLDWQRRQAALVAQGWRVLRFANTDVRDRPERCAEFLRLLLRAERGNQTYVAELETQLREARDRLGSRVQEERAGYGGPGKVDQATAREELDRVTAQLAAALANPRLSDAEREKLQRFEESQRRLAHLEEESSTMKTTIWAFTFLLAIALVLGFLALSSGRESAPVASLASVGEPSGALPMPASSSPEAAVPAEWDGFSCDSPIRWQQARDALGKNVAVVGPVISVTRRDDVNGRPTWIEIGAAFPSRERLIGIIWGDHSAEFDGLVGPGLEGRVVCLLGEIEDYRGVPRIELRSRGQLQIR